MKWRLRPKRDYVFIRSAPELIEHTMNLKVTHGGALHPTQEAIVAAVSTVGYAPLHHLDATPARYTSDPEALTFGYVTDIGPGHAGMVEERPGLRVGDLVGYRRNRIADEIEDFHTGGARKLVAVHEHGIPARYPDGPGMLPQPLGSWLLTEPDPDGARQALGRRMPLTPNEVDEGIVTRVHEAPGAHHGSAHAKKGSIVANKDRLLIERVLATGPGRYVRAIFQAPEEFPNRGERWVPNECGKGELVCFRSAVSKGRFYYFGRRLTFVQWSDVAYGFVADEEAAE